MKITVLMENTTPSDRFAARHGLSLFLETEGGVRILFDVGPDESFLENALAAGVDVRTAHAAACAPIWTRPRSCPRPCRSTMPSVRSTGMSPGRPSIIMTSGSIRH